MCVGAMNIQAGPWTRCLLNMVNRLMRGTAIRRLLAKSSQSASGIGVAYRVASGATM